MFAFEATPDLLIHARQSLVRPDLYRPIHKALRASMAEVMVALGHLDLDDTDAFDHTLLRTQRLLDHLAAHVEHENTFLHPAIARAAPDAATHTAGEHDAHAADIAALRERLQELKDACGQRERRALALCLYREFAAFVGRNLVHMHEEESVNTAALWAAHSDAELHALHERLVAHVDPQILAELQPWMVRALDPAELADLYAGLRASLPPAAYAAALELARAELEGERHAALVRALMAPDLALAA
ncbi:hypothetical protein [Thiomonas bhubaneswarensis]|uniref:Hemerythrin HHE cation binding domain n=1 Tax=Thiomonas bhubaneswarensis TaxID=339866 RepID=A0A0K6HUL9_9BURK|nr:hypothetical protein [Thiomonas bhubaneswarensis]CUA94488.1 Hemerythrin HHE cation binding domain [Thiomonas bhubaneswarensis]